MLELPLFGTHFVSPNIYSAYPRCRAVAHSHIRRICPQVLRKQYTSHHNLAFNLVAPNDKDGY